MRCGWQKFGGVGSRRVAPDLKSPLGHPRNVGLARASPGRPWTSAHGSRHRGEVLQAEQRWEPGFEGRRRGAGPAGRGAGGPAVSTRRGQSPGVAGETGRMFSSCWARSETGKQSQRQSCQSASTRGHGHGDEAHARPPTRYVRVIRSSFRLGPSWPARDTEHEPERARDAEREKGTRISLF